jgi:predicted dienelactone hydrolase
VSGAEAGALKAMTSYTSIISPVAAVAALLLLLLSSGGLAQQLSPTVLQLPSPTGPFAVGRTEFHWIDSTRTDPFASVLSARREVIVYVWYPAQRLASARPAPYIPHYETIAATIGDSGMAAEFGSAQTAIGAGELHSYSFAEAPLKMRGRPFPVLVFSHGFGESSLTYSAQLEDLASHGYVVFGIEHPSDAYAVPLSPSHVVDFAKAAWDSVRARPNGAAAYQLAQVPVRAADIRFVLDQIWRMEAVPGGARFARTLDLMAGQPRSGSNSHFSSSRPVTRYTSVPVRRLQPRPTSRT